MLDALMSRKMVIAAIWHKLIDVWIDFAQLKKLEEQIKMILKLELV